MTPDLLYSNSGPQISTRPLDPLYSNSGPQISTRPLDPLYCNSVPPVLYIMVPGPLCTCSINTASPKLHVHCTHITERTCMSYLARSTAVSLPIPALPPVIITVFPSSLILLVHGTPLTKNVYQHQDK